MNGAHAADGLTVGHALEPWLTDGWRIRASGAEIAVFDDDSQDFAADLANADRASACVNALAKIADPAAFVAAVRGLVGSVGYYRECPACARGRGEPHVDECEYAAIVAALEAP